MSRRCGAAADSSLSSSSSSMIATVVEAGTGAVSGDEETLEELDCSFVMSEASKWAACSEALAVCSTSVDTYLGVSCSVEISRGAVAVDSSSISDRDVDSIDCSGNWEGCLVSVDSPSVCGSDVGVECCSICEACCEGAFGTVGEVS